MPKPTKQEEPSSMETLTGCSATIFWFVTLFFIVMYVAGCIKGGDPHIN